MQMLVSLELVLNHTLRHLIQNWCEAHGGDGSSDALVRLLSIPSVPMAANTVARMLRKVQSSVDPLPSLKNIRSVARKSERNCKCIQESDAIFVLASVIGCCNPNLGLATKAKGLHGCEPRGSPRIKAKALQGCGPTGSRGVTSHILGSVRKCEGV
jgi:hypothetical protein